MHMGIDWHRQSKAKAVDFANPDQFGSQVHPGRKMFWGGACVDVEPGGWGEIKQGETGEEHTGWRGLAEWMPGTRERGMEKECQGLRRKRWGKH